MPAKPVTLPDVAIEKMSDRAKESLPANVDVKTYNVVFDPAENNSSLSGTLGEVDYFVFDLSDGNLARSADAITNFEVGLDKILFTNYIDESRSSHGKTEDTTVTVLGFSANDADGSRIGQTIELYGINYFALEEFVLGGKWKKHRRHRCPRPHRQFHGRPDHLRKQSRRQEEADRTDCQEPLLL